MIHYLLIGVCILDEYIPSTLETIERLRRSILVHSHLYYEMNTNIISDIEFDRRAMELVRLQGLHPTHNEDSSYMATIFKGFTGETAFHLPYKDLGIMAVAKRLLTNQSKLG